MSGVLATTNLLPSLALLACPVGMGVMMWLMVRTGRRTDQRATRPEQPASVEVLREEHRRLAAEIERLEAGAGDAGTRRSR